MGFEKLVGRGVRVIFVCILLLKHHIHLSLIHAALTENNNRQSDKKEIRSWQTINISDQSIVFAYRKLSNNGTSRGHIAITYKNLPKFNREHFRNDVASQSWDQIYCLNDMWLQWERLFLSIVDQLVPLRTMRRAALCRAPKGKNPCRTTCYRTEDGIDYSGIAFPTPPERPWQARSTKWKHCAQCF